MARGSSYGEQQPLPPISVTPQTSIPRRATRILPEVHVEEEDEEETCFDTEPVGRFALRPAPKKLALSPAALYPGYTPLARHRSWLAALVLCMERVVRGLTVISCAGIFQTTPDPPLVK